MSETRKPPNKKPTQEQIYTRRGMVVLGVGAAALIAANHNTIASGIAGIPAHVKNVVMEMHIPKATDANKVIIGDKIEFKNQDGKVVVRRVGQISDITNAVSEADPNLLSNDVSDLLARENNNSALTYTGDEYLVPKDWGIEDIGE